MRRRPVGYSGSGSEWRSFHRQSSSRSGKQHIQCVQIESVGAQQPGVPGQRLGHEPLDGDARLHRSASPLGFTARDADMGNGIEAMEREETAYWLGMAMHRPNPRRVLSALRNLLTVPKATGRRS